MKQTVRTAAANLSFAWGVGGIVLLLGFAIYRLLPHALESLHYGLAWWQWLMVGVWCIFMVVSEGYDGFQKRLVPRIYERAQKLRMQGGVIERIFAPLYCLNYFNAEVRRMAVAYLALVLIIGAVIIVHTIEQPWRGMIDWGVIAGLGYGLIALVLFRRASS